MHKIKIANLKKRNTMKKKGNLTIAEKARFSFSADTHPELLKAFLKYAPEMDADGDRK